MLLFSRKLKLSIYTSFRQAFFPLSFFANISGQCPLSRLFYVNVAAQIKREEVLPTGGV